MNNKNEKKKTLKNCLGREPKRFRTVLKLPRNPTKTGKSDSNDRIFGSTSGFLRVPNYQTETTTC